MIDHGFFHGIERRPAAFEHPPACGHGVAHAVEMSFDHVIRNGPGAAVDDQNRIVQEESSSGNEDSRAGQRIVWVGHSCPTLFDF